MALSLSDPSAVMEVYESVVKGEYNWLLLTYANDNQADELVLFAHGSGGLTELKNNVDDLGQVFIGFYRDEEVDVDPEFLLINYIPTSASGVKRARALVHSHRIGAVFTKHDTTLTVDDLSNLTTHSVHQALEESETPQVMQMGRATSQPVKTLMISQLSRAQPVRRSASENQTLAAPPTLGLAGSSTVLTNLLRRKKRPGESPDEVEDDAPPIPPPKDKGEFSLLQVAHQGLPRQASSPHLRTSSQPMQASSHLVSPETQSILLRQRNYSVSEFAVISHSSSLDKVVLEPDHSTNCGRPLPQLAVGSLPIAGKWSSAGFISDPAERARRRMETQRQREIDIEEALREESERQALLKREKEEILRREEEEEARRRAFLAEELRRVTAERRRKERSEQREEERRRREREEKKQLDRQRRLEAHQRLEQWRREQARMAEESVQRAEQARRQEDEEREKKIQLAKAKLKQNVKTESGWVTMQTNDSLFWKRRYYTFTGSTAYFYRSPKDINQVLDKVNFHGQLRGLREWNEGYEELESIRHSFAIEFKDDRGSWSMFTDSEEEKFKLLGLLHHTAGL